jgi:hypothetical protein
VCVFPSPTFAAEDISITLTKPDALPTKTGDSVAWSANIFNNGTFAASGYVQFRVSEPLKTDDKSFLYWQPTFGSGCETQDACTIKCTFSNIAAGTVKYVPITMKRGTWCNTRSYFLYASASITVPSTYTLMTEQSDYEQTGCQMADTTVELTGPKEYTPGDAATKYTVTVTNIGEMDTASDAGLQVQTPMGYIVTAPKGCSEQQKRDYRCTLGTLSPKGKKSFTFIMKVPTSACVSKGSFSANVLVPDWNGFASVDIQCVTPTKKK